MKIILFLQTEGMTSREVITIIECIGGIHPKINNDISAFDADQERNTVLMLVYSRTKCDILQIGSYDLMASIVNEGDVKLHQVHTAGELVTQICTTYKYYDYGQ